MIYKSLDGKPERRIVFITTDDEGSIESVTMSQGVFGLDKTGYSFIVDDYVADQINKFKVVNGNLELLDGEQLDEPVKSEKELQREELLRQLALLDADIEEVTDEP